MTQNILTVGIWFKFQNIFEKKNTVPRHKKKTFDILCCSDFYDATGPHNDKKK